MRLRFRVRGRLNAESDLVRHQLHRFDPLGYDEMLGPMVNQYARNNTSPGVFLFFISRIPHDIADRQNHGILLEVITGLDGTCPRSALRLGEQVTSRILRR